MFSFLRLYTDLLKDSLNEYSYDAEVAGLHYNIENQLEGMLVCIGIHGKAQSFLNVLLTLLAPTAWHWRL